MELREQREGMECLASLDGWEPPVLLGDPDHRDQLERREWMEGSRSGDPVRGDSGDPLDPLDLSEPLEETGPLERLEPPEQMEGRGLREREDPMEHLDTRDTMEDLDWMEDTVTVLREELEEEEVMEEEEQTRLCGCS